MDWRVLTSASVLCCGRSAIVPRRSHELKGLAMRQEVADSNPTVPEFQRRLAGNLLAIGWRLSQAGKPREALEYHTREEAIWQSLPRAESAVPDHRDSLANCHTNIANARPRLGRTADAQARCALAPGFVSRWSQPNLKARIFAQDSPKASCSSGDAGASGRPRRGRGRLAAGGRALRLRAQPSSRNCVLPRVHPRRAIGPRRDAWLGRVGRRENDRGRSGYGPASSSRGDE